MLDDMLPENGPLMVMPGSHKGPTYDHHLDGYFLRRHRSGQTRSRSLPGGRR